jgi:transposase
LVDQNCPGIGPALARALVATVADPKALRSGRDFSAWIGLVPTQHSSAGKNRLRGIREQGDRYLHSLFVVRSPCPLCQDLWHGASTLDYGIAGAATDEGRRHRSRQQDRADGLGHDSEGECYKEPVALAA